jgi:hypothetical protein
MGGGVGLLSAGKVNGGAVGAGGGVIVEISSALT